MVQDIQWTADSLPPHTWLARPSALQLSQVSSRWRRLVRSSPTLWAVIDSSVTRSFALLDLFLAMSQDSLLLISLQLVTWHHLPFRRSLTALCACSYRWMVFHISVEALIDGSSSLKLFASAYSPAALLFTRSLRWLLASV